MSKILILGVSGMLGHGLLDYLSDKSEHDVKGTVRYIRNLPEVFRRKHISRIYTNVDIYDKDSILNVIKDFDPDVVINAIGIIKQLDSANNVQKCIYVNSLFPHRLRDIIGPTRRLIHISTDCVFDGKKGDYTEQDNPNPEDLYGRSKLLGEISNVPNTITLRTSIIGHELLTSNGLVEWFLKQERKNVLGYARALYTGFTVLELSNIIYKYVIDSQLQGLYQVSSELINKYNLLSMINTVYDLGIKLEINDSIIIDRSLNSEKFKRETGYVCPTWYTMIKDMHENYVKDIDIYKIQI
jgi:dTDP-4-dehydrorhamnose reductase